MWGGFERAELHDDPFIGQSFLADHTNPSNAPKTQLAPSTPSVTAHTPGPIGPRTRPPDRRRRVRIGIVHGDRPRVARGGVDLRRAPGEKLVDELAPQAAVRAGHEGRLIRQCGYVCSSERANDEHRERPPGCSRETPTFGLCGGDYGMVTTTLPLARPVPT